MSTNCGEKELLLYANYYYHRMGFNVTGISNVKNKYNEFDKNLSKTPNHPWLYLTKNRQDIDIFNSYNWQSAVGIGTVLGYINLRAIDVDGCQSYEFITKTLKMLNLPLDYEWVVKSGSGIGFHIIFYSEDHNFSHEAGDPNPNISFGPNDSNRGIFERLELRWIGHLVLPPSSLHNYHFANINIPKNRPKEVSSEQITLFVQSTCRKIFEEVIGSDGGRRYVVDDIESFTHVSNSNVSIISNWIPHHGASTKF